MAANDIVAKYVLRFSDMASKNMLHTATVAGRLKGALGAAAISAAAAGAAIAAGAVYAGKKIFDLTSQYAEWVDELAESGAKVNVTANYLRDLRSALGQAGVEAAQVDAGLSKFNIGLGQMATGTGAFEKKLKAVAPALAAQLKGVKDGTTANRIALGYLGSIEDAQERVTVAVATYGKQAGPAFAAAAADLDALNRAFKRSQKINPNIDGNAVALVDEYQAKMGDAAASLKAVGMVIGAAALPAITELADRFSAYIANNKEAIASGAETFFKKVGDALANIDFEQLGNGITSLADNLPGIVSSLATIVEYAPIIAGMFIGSKIVGWIASIWEGVAALRAYKGAAALADAADDGVGRGSPDGKPRKGKNTGKAPRRRGRGGAVAGAVAAIGADIGINMALDAAMDKAEKAGAAATKAGTASTKAAGLAAKAGAQSATTWATVTSGARVAGPWIARAGLKFVPLIGWVSLAYDGWQLLNYAMSETPKKANDLANASGRMADRFKGDLDAMWLSALTFNQQFNTLEFASVGPLKDGYRFSPRSSGTPSNQGPIKVIVEAKPGTGAEVWGNNKPNLVNKR